VYGRGSAPLAELGLTLVVLAAALAAAVRAWWTPQRARRTYTARHSAFSKPYHPHRPYGTLRPPLAAVVAHCWEHDS